MYDLSREELLTEILKITDAHGFNDNVMPGYLYSKILYLLEDLQPLLTKEELRIIELHGVQRGIGFLADWPDPREIPHECYAVHDGNVVIIQKDVPQCIDLGLELKGDAAQRYVDDENLKLEVTPAQVSAMMSGLIDGWDKQTAYASFYLAEKKECSQPQKPRVADPDGNGQLAMEGA